LSSTFFEVFQTAFRLLAVRPGTDLRDSACHRFVLLLRFAISGALEGFTFACPSALLYYTALVLGWQVLFGIFRKSGFDSAFSPVFMCGHFPLLVNCALGKTAGFFKADFPYLFHSCLARRAFSLPVRLYTLYIAVLAWNGFAPIFRNFRCDPLSVKKRRVFLAKATKHKILWSIA
jgi:hypothetical protein